MFDKIMEEAGDQKVVAQAMASMEQLIVLMLPEIKKYQEITKMPDSAANLGPLYERDVIAATGYPSTYESMKRRLDLFVKFGEDITKELEAVGHPIIAIRDKAMKGGDGNVA